MGVPIIQLPADVMATRGDLGDQAGCHHRDRGRPRRLGAVHWPSLLELLGKGKVIGVDIDIRVTTGIRSSAIPWQARFWTRDLRPTARRWPGSLRRSGVSLGDGRARFRPQPRPRGSPSCAATDPLVTEGCYLVIADTLLGHLDPGKRRAIDRRSGSRANEP